MGRSGEGWGGVGRGGEGWGGVADLEIYQDGRNRHARDSLRTALDVYPVVHRYLWWVIVLLFSFFDYYRGFII